MIYAFLFSKIVILFLYSVVLCLALPQVGNLMIHVSRAIPWSTILKWIANKLCQIIQEQPTIVFAPVLWFVLLTTPLWKPNFEIPAADKEPTKFNRRQRRNFAKLLKTSFNPQKEQRRRNVKNHLPFRLRKKFHEDTFKAPDIEARQYRRDQIGRAHV